MRVNARLDDESQQQIEYLTAATGMGVSQVLRESVNLYYRQARASESGARHLLALVGQGHSGRADTASSVKSRVAQAMAEKYAAPPAAKPVGVGTKPAAKPLGVGTKRAARRP